MMKKKAIIARVRMPLTHQFFHLGQREREKSSNVKQECESAHDASLVRVTSAAFLSPLHTLPPSNTGRKWCLVEMILFFPTVQRTSDTLAQSWSAEGQLNTEPWERTLGILCSSVMLSASTSLQHFKNNHGY